MLVITDNFKIVSQDGHGLKGSCLRCGACCECRKCEHLKYETLDGKKRASCSIYMSRPVGCAIWPMRDSVIPNNCGFSWGDI